MYMEQGLGRQYILIVTPKHIFGRQRIVICRGFSWNHEEKENVRLKLTPQLPGQKKKRKRKKKSQDQKNQQDGMRSGLRRGALWSGACAPQHPFTNTHMQTPTYTQNAYIHKCTQTRIYKDTQTHIHTRSVEIVLWTRDYRRVSDEPSKIPRP